MERRRDTLKGKKLMTIGIIATIGLLVLYARGLEKFEREFHEELYRRSKPLKELPQTAARQEILCNK